jgi:hypothetical protein
MALETALYVRFDVDNIMHVDLTLEKAWCNFPKGLSFSLNQFSSQLCHSPNLAKPAQTF